MTVRFQPAEWLHRLQTSLWLLPAAMVFGSAGIAVFLVQLHDPVSARAIDNWPALFGAGAEGSRAMLTAIAGSMITVAGVVFSITLVTLSLASTQYSPRVLRNFLADRANQAVLGVFVGVFTYCLIVLRSIRGPGEAAFVPDVAVLGAIALAFVAIGFLIFFIHHVSTLIQASAILERIATETCRSIDGWVFGADEPTEDGSASTRQPESEATVEWRTGCAPRVGYVISINYDRLHRVAERSGRCVRVERGVGEFAIAGQPLVSIAGGGESYEQDLRNAVDTFEIGRQRTAGLDPAFGVRQIVDVALKSLSSGQSDPTTARNSIDYLTAVLVQGLRSDAVDESCRGSRVERRATSYCDLVRVSFSEIRQAAGSNLAVLGALTTSLETLEEFAERPARRAALGLQAQAMLEAVRRSGEPAVDLEGLRVRLERLIAKFETARS